MNELAEVRRGPGRPPTVKNPPPQFINRAVRAASFCEGGVQFLSIVKTGLNCVHDRCDMWIVGPGVLVRFNGHDYIVPFAHIKHIALEDE